jgi:hypothetical protein
MSRGLDMTRAELEGKGYRIEGNTVHLPTDDMQLGDALGELLSMHVSRNGFAPNKRAYKSKWESQYAAQVLDLEMRTKVISWWDYEGMRFRLADGTYYTPDFVVMTTPGHLVAREVKGFWRESARVRVKVCARCFPWLRIDVISKHEGRWVTMETLNA